MPTLLETRLAESRARGLYPYNLPLTRTGPARATLDGREYVVASSYDYLSLIGHPRIDQAAREAVARHGTATGGVRLLTGTTPEHLALEAHLAALYGTEDCVTFSSGYFANIGAMAAVGSRRTLAYVDALSHRSVIDACVLAGAPMQRFRHNDAAHLRELLRTRPAGRRAVVFVESVYSMDGDLAPVAEIARVAADEGATLLMDDAHGLGVLDAPGGAGGGHFGVAPGTVKAWVGSLSKAVPSSGGFVATDAATADRVRHVAGPYIFSAAATPASVAAAGCALEVMAREPWRREQLRENVRVFAAGLDRPFAGHPPESPILPIHYPDDGAALAAAAFLRGRGVLATPIVAPAVGASRPRLRVCINAAHSADDLAALADGINRFDRTLPRPPC
ncbi:MAG TPA: pyridoxal phosphate-dependent aminotransferase family protein [Longimicrobium sp.]|nr:pyridoxal phosphate-dependent aminotransferase family protein [Longimicrobium sp.]